MRRASQSASAMDLRDAAGIGAAMDLDDAAGIGAAMDLHDAAGIGAAMDLRDAAGIGVRDGPTRCDADRGRTDRFFGPSTLRLSHDAPPIA